MQITMYTRNLTNNHLIWSTNFNCFIFRCIYYAVVLEWRTWIWQFFPFFPRSSFISLLAFWRTGTTPLAVAFEDESFYSIEFTKTCKLIEHFLSYVYAIPMFQYVSRHWKSKFVLWRFFNPQRNTCIWSSCKFTSFK